MQDTEEEPWLVITNENNKEENHYALKFNINEEELPTKYEWIFDLIIEANYKWFGKDRIIMVYDLRVKNCETFYNLARTLIGIYNYSIINLELLGIEEMKNLLESDRTKKRTHFVEITKRYSTEKYKNKTIWNEYNHNKSIGSSRIYSESNFEKFYDAKHSLDFFMAEVFLIFYNKLVNIYSTNSTVKANQAEESEQNIRPSIRAIALYHVFRIEKGIESPFDKRQILKTKAIEEVTDEWEIDNSTFRRELKIANHPKTRKNIKYKKDYEQAIQLLNKDKHTNKEAIILANDELKIFAPLR